MNILVVLLATTLTIATALFLSLGLVMPKKKQLNFASNDQILVFNDGMIRMQSVGQGEENIIFLHGFNGSLEQWDPIWKLLLGCQIRSVRLDIPGFGFSSWQTSDFSLAAQAQRLIALMDKLHMTKASFVGNSMGASLAAWFAASYPERTRSLWLLAPSGAAGALGYQGLFGFYTSNPIANTFGRIISKTWLFQSLFSNRMTVQALETSASYGPIWDSRLPKIKANVWIAWSAADRIARAETARSVHGAISGAKLEWLSLASGHDLIASHADLIARRICDGFSFEEEESIGATTKTQKNL